MKLKLYDNSPDCRVGRFKTKEKLNVSIGLHACKVSKSHAFALCAQS